MVGSPRATEKVLDRTVDTICNPESPRHYTGGSIRGELPITGGMQARAGCSGGRHSTGGVGIWQRHFTQHSALPRVVSHPGLRLSHTLLN